MKTWNFRNMKVISHCSRTHLRFKMNIECFSQNWSVTQVMLCFSRDTEVLSVFNHSAANPVHAVLKNKPATLQYTVAFPPSGVIPFHGFTMYGKLLQPGSVFKCFYFMINCPDWQQSYYLHEIHFPPSNLWFSIFVDVYYPLFIIIIWHYNPLWVFTF